MQLRPSQSPITEYVDARKAFVQHAEIGGHLALSKLTRAADILADKEGLLEANLRFSTDDAGIKRIVGSLRAQVNTVCQRCLNPVQVTVEDEIHLVMAIDHDKAKELEQRLDKNVEFWVSDAEKISIAEVLEDQLILSLPIASYHEVSQCEALGFVVGNLGAEERGENSGRTASPFAGLADLLADQNKKAK